MIFKSLRWRVQRGHVFFMLLMFPVLAILPYLQMRHARVVAVDKELAISLAHTTSRQFVEYQPEIDQLFKAPIWFRIYHSEGELMHQSSHTPEFELDTLALELDQFAWIDGHRTLTIQRVKNARTIIIGIPKEAVYEDLEALPFFIITLCLITGASALTVGWWAAGKSLSPIQNFTDIAKRISQGDHFETIDLAGTEHELRDLGVVLNQAFQRLHHALQQQKNLTADASHELRTPISVILLELESALRKERSPAEYKERLQSALETTEQLKQLVDSLMVLARSDAGLNHLQLCRSDLQDVCQEVLQLLSPKAREAKITLESDLQSVVTDADAERLKQVLINLINNALQYAAPGATIQLGLKENDSNVLITVDDDGPGIPEASQARLFDRFYRADESRSTKQGNLGLGLSICKTIVDAHNGSIEIDTSQESGAHFIISLPRCSNPNLSTEIQS